MAQKGKGRIGIENRKKVLDLISTSHFQSKHLYFQIAIEKGIYKKNSQKSFYDHINHLIKEEKLITMCTGKYDLIKRA